MIKNLKILHIIPNLRKGGAERLVLDICNELGKREGVAVKLITFTGQNEYKFLIQNIDWEVVPASVKLSLRKKNSFEINKLQAAIEDFEPDIIHTHLFDAEIVSRCCNYPQAKWFSHCHDNMRQFKNFSICTFFNKLLITNYYEKRFLFNRYKANGGNIFIAISKSTQSYLAKTVKPYQVTLFPNAINFQLFNKFIDRPSINQKLRLVNVGSFVENKNQKFLIDVVRFLKNKNITVELSLIGDGKNSFALQKLTSDFKLNDSIIFHGLVNSVEKILWQSDIYVHSAFSEALGLTLIEAMAAGLPVITLDGKGNRDLIIEGRNGYMLYTQNVVEFANKIMELWNDKEKYKEMSFFAQNFAKEFDINNYIDRLGELYKSELS